jgi:Zinc dependent phospholipase C
MSRTSAGVTLAVLILCAAPLAVGYSVITHEAIIDSAWTNIKPILLQRFPATPREDLKKAHAYAYGGCIIQDMGYYPLGSKYFSDLAHYVRSGDFVEALLHDAQDVNELAFALGALAHYAADVNGHSIAVNPAVAIGYPKLRAEYGSVVTYEDDPPAHLKTEFGFDVAQVAQGNYAAEDYHDFIGFQVSKELLERAFRDTYGLELKDQFLSLDLALGTYRRTVSTIIPEATKVAWALKKKDIVQAHPGVTERKFIYNLERSSYEKEWGNQYSRPGLFARFVAFLFRLIPNVGPFKSVDFKAPTPQTEKLFMQSFNKTLDAYRRLLRQVSAGSDRLLNADFDTGHPTRPGEYELADETYAKLLRDLAKQGFKDTSPELRANLQDFYRDPKPPPATSREMKRTDPKAWAQTLTALAQLQALR